MGGNIYISILVVRHALYQGVHQERRMPEERQLETFIGGDKPEDRFNDDLKIA